MSAGLLLSFTVGAQAQSAVSKFDRKARNWSREIAEALPHNPFVRDVPPGNTPGATQGKMLYFSVAGVPRAIFLDLGDNGQVLRCTFLDITAEGAARRYLYDTDCDGVAPKLLEVDNDPDDGIDIPETTRLPSPEAHYTVLRDFYMMSRLAQVLVSHRAEPSFALSPSAQVVQENAALERRVLYHAILGMGRRNGAVQTEVTGGQNGYGLTLSARLDGNRLVDCLLSAVDAASGERTNYMDAACDGAFEWASVGDETRFDQAQDYGGSTAEMIHSILSELHEFVQIWGLPVAPDN
ncbi:hypothetical protein [Pseudooceanicola sp. LIPI14-2-Ac024]|uniref:hypothetical protein n=1 Tax=Pseudooceanicola sp. LIPI14-2-Ac024 TaxID=3344875 RepID=UPI0035CF6EBF